MNDKTSIDYPTHANAIAIVGMACRFPGAKNIEEYWENLQRGRESIRPLTTEELQAAGVPRALWQDPNYVKAAPVLDDVECFDASLFGYSPREAEMMDPQQRIFLECAWEVLEKAGYNPATYAGNIGVFAGAGGSISSYLLAFASQFQSYLGDTGGLQHIANDKDFLSTRTAFKLNLRGPSLTVQTACSTSLVSVHLACQSLLTGECDMALAGGVTVRVPHHAGHLYREGGILSPDGHCRTFDAEARGTIFGSGVGLVVLKPLAHAIEDGDHIHAVIRGTAINNDGGEKISYTASSMEGQVRAISEAMAVANVTPETIGFVEAHGTATALGDPLEIAALTQAYRASTDECGFCAIGSVKSNIGHLEGAAGIAGLIKAALALENRYIPPSLHFVQENPRIGFENRPFYVNTELESWTKGPHPRRAAVNSLGIGGTNAHAILEEAPAPTTRAVQPDRPVHILRLSAKTPTALTALTERFANHLGGGFHQPLGDICFTANTGRAELGYRMAAVAASPQEMSAKLAEYSHSQRSDTAHADATSTGAPGPVTFLFTGQGSQYVGMARALYEHQPTFRQLLQTCDQILHPLIDHSLISLLYASSAQESLLDQTMYTQPVLFALEYALAMLWRSWGIEPDMVMGHSVGEFAAACVAGVFSLEQGLRLVAARGRAMQTIVDNGLMAAVMTGRDTVLEAIAPHGDRVTIAAYNGPNNTVISGPRDAVHKVLTQLERQSVSCHPLRGRRAFHSAMVEPVLDEFAATAAAIEYYQPQLGLVSNVSGALVADNTTIDANYWRAHARGAVKFADGMETLYKQGQRIFIEIGPHPVLVAMGQACIEDIIQGDGAAQADAATPLWIPSLRRGQCDWQSMLQSVATVYTHGLDIDWAAFDGDYQHRRVPLPTYPFEHQRHWLSHRTESPGATAGPQRAEMDSPWIGERIMSPLEDIQYQCHFSAHAPEFLDDHRIYSEIVVPGASHLAMTLSAVKETTGRDACTLEDFVFPRAMIIPDESRALVQLTLRPQGRNDFFITIHSTPLADSDAAGDWRQHATGTIITHDNPVSPPVQDTTVAENAYTRLGKSVSTADFYRRFYSDRKIDLGTTFQWIEEVWSSPSELVCRMRQAVADDGTYQLHPGLIDACFQFVIAALPNDATYIPFGVDRLRFYGKAQGPLWCRAVLKQDHTGNADSFSADLTLWGNDGQTVFDAVGLRLKRAEQATLQRATQNTKSEEWLYDWTWQLQESPEHTGSLPQLLPATNTRGRWIIFADQFGLGRAIGERLKQHGHDHVMVVPGSSYWRGDGYVLLNPYQDTDYERLVRDELLEASHECLGIIHLWSLQCGQDIVSDEQQLSTEQPLSWGSALALARVLSTAGLATLPRMWLVTRGVHGIASEVTAAGLAQAPLWGLGRVIAQELPELWGGMIDLAVNPLKDAGETGTSGLDTDADGILRQIYAPYPSSVHTHHYARQTNAAKESQRPREDQILLRSDRAYVGRLRPLRGTQANTLAFDQEASYLITGGLGGLGLRTAQWLVERGARHIALMGRSTPAPQAEAQIEALQRAGARIFVLRGDVCQREELAAALAAVERELPPLRGCFHTAGVIDDGVIQTQSDSQFADVLGPKMAGAWNLHLATQHLDLHHFVLYSSISAIIGAPGQSNYAAGNAFLDALAHYRRAHGLPALSINWGPWADIGMAASLSERGQQRWQDQGIRLMNPEQGMRLLAQLMGHENAVQVAAVGTDWRTFHAHHSTAQALPWLADIVSTAPPAPAQASAATPSSVGQRLQNASHSDRLAILDQYVRERLIATLGLAAHDSVSPHRGFAEMGMDSLMAIDMRNELVAGLGHSLPSTVLFDYPNLERLVHYLASEVLGLLSPSSREHDARSDDAKVAADARQADDWNALRNLSEDEAEALLIAELAEIRG